MLWFSGNRWTYWEMGILVGIVFLQVLRFWNLDTAPSGFYVDEAAGAAHVMCLLETGTSFHGDFLKLFYSSLGGGYTTSVFALMQSVWTFFMGTSVIDFRAFSVFSGVFSVWGIFLIASHFAGRKAGLLASLLLSVSPWFFLNTRIAWDPPLVLPFLIFGMVFFFTVPRKWYFSLFSGLCFSLAMLSYPPTKVQLALLLPLLFFFQYRFNVLKAIRQEYPFLILFIFFTILLGIFYWNYPEALSRSELLSITGGYYWDVVAKTPQTIMGVIEVFFQNVAQYFSYNFLWEIGDTNLRHHTGFGGMMSLFEIIGSILGIGWLMLSKKYISKRNQQILMFCLLGYLFGVIPAALTWDGSPHALRAIGAIPFGVLFASFSFLFLWEKIKCKIWSKWIFLLLLIPAFFSGLYFYDFFTNYPAKSTAWFQEEVLQIAKDGKQTGDFSRFEERVVRDNYEPLAKSYFLMEFKEEKCIQLQTNH